jgi:hypothetical protein
MFIDDMHNFTTIHPCYVMDPSASDGSNLGSGLSAYTGAAVDMPADVSCSLAWITSGRAMRDNCLSALGDQATPMQAYIAALFDKPTVPALYDFEYGCNDLLSWPEKTLGNVFVEQSRSVDTYLTSDRAHGSFFPTSSLKNWVEDSQHFATQLQMSNTVDELTRKFIVYIVTRNVNEGGLFYSAIKVTCSLSVEGKTSADLDIIFSPMIDFSYGTNNHSWVRAVLCCAVPCCAVL